MVDNQRDVLVLTPIIFPTIVLFIVPIIIIFVIRYRGLLSSNSSNYRRLSMWLSTLAAIASLVGAVMSLYITYIVGQKKLGLMNILVTPAYAQFNSSTAASPGSPAISPPAYLGALLTAILIVLLLILLSGVIGSLLIPDIPANASRRAAANDIVKTFGGFFIGILTSFLKQATGSP